MGQNIKFKIGNMCKGDDFTAGVTWYLEWNKKQIPFTRGSSFFECSMEGTKLVIKRAQAQGVIESPIKPGHSSLIRLKMVTSLFDTFPKATECTFPKESRRDTKRNTKGLQQGFGTVYKPVFGVVHSILEIHAVLAQQRTQDIGLHFKGFQQAEDIDSVP
ncbi:hypothetical protein Acr_25g0008860 [Actinidia rufa]|uniref:Uncharacterized protein n=1 Tax=Actinidia rufa TaxID=165716 RepID=A0A7J0H060_9ERIC|nr:hypothetical protein Acr_25g0008860 [Actinidia rufa]